MSFGCLVIHGLTGTPATVASIANPLVEKGFRVSSPCLAGHGGSMEELASSTWQQWYGTVRDAYAALRKEVDLVFFAGISLGALLGLKLAIDEGWGVRGLVLIGTPLRLPLLNRLAIPIVRYSPLRWAIKSVPKDFESSVLDPEGCALYKQFSLPSIPARSAFQLNDLIREINRDLVNVSSPTLMIHGEHDLVAPTSNMDLIAQKISSDVVERLVLKKSAHVVTMDSEKDVAAAAAVDFFKHFM
jgi:carboxylesterase